MTAGGEIDVELVIVDCGRCEVLVQEGSPPTLPRLVLPGPYPPHDHVLTDAVTKTWNLRTSIMRPLWYSRLVLEARQRTTPPGLTWLTADDVSDLVEPPGVVRSVLDEIGRPPPPRRPAWFGPGWLDSAGAWIDEMLGTADTSRAGDLVQIKHWSQSSVLKVPTTTGDLYFKAVIPELAGDPALSTVLARRFRSRVPEIVATDDTQSRWLSRDFGGVSAWDLPGERHGCVVALAEMQVGFVDHVADLVAAGRTLRTGADLAAAIDPLLARGDIWQDPTLPRALSARERDQLLSCGSRLAALCDGLDRGPIPLTLTHGDFEPLNAVRTTEGWLIHDWNYAAVAHPFFDLACWLSDCEDSEAAAATAWYLQQWRPFASDAELARQWAMARPVGALSELLKFVGLCDAIEPSQWFAWTPMLFGWTRRLIRACGGSAP